MYRIEKIDYHVAMEIVVTNHYLHRTCPCKFAFGLINNETNGIDGVVIYGVPPSSTLLRGICGDEEKQNVYELNRLWVTDHAPKNSESYLIANTIKLLDREIVVSFADTSQGHIGYVYQATNFIYTGLSSKFKDPKVKGLEHQHHATYAKGLTMSQLREKFGEENVYWAERPRKHRYIFFNCGRKRKKELMDKLQYKILPYPKEQSTSD
jgi:hypothetical protein